MYKKCKNINKSLLTIYNLQLKYNIYSFALLFTVQLNKRKWIQHNEIVTRENDYIIYFFLETAVGCSLLVECFGLLIIDLGW